MTVTLIIQNISGYQQQCKNSQDSANYLGSRIHPIIYIFQFNVMSEKAKKLKQNSDIPIDYSFQQECQICLIHSTPLQFLCFSCKAEPLCSSCTRLGAHQGHDLKNLQRCRQLLRSQLQEWAIRLQSKSEILDVLDEQFFNSRVQLFKSSQRYKESLLRQFDQIKKNLQDKRKEIFNSINQYASNYKVEAERQGQLIRKKRKQIEKTLEDTKQKLLSNLSMQALFYSKQKQNIQQLLNQSQINTYKQAIIEPCWGIDSSILKRISYETNQLEFTLKYPSASKRPSDILKLMTKKQKNNSKKQFQSIEKTQIKGLSNSHVQSKTIISFATPKNLSREKTKIGDKKSPQVKALKKKKRQSVNMFSMPASPTKSREFSCQKQPKQVKYFKKK